MKNIYLTILLFIFALSSYAQKDSPHLKFKGEPIDGTLMGYTSKLENKGFTFIDKDDSKHISLLKGDFLIYQNCRIFVTANKNQDLVSIVSVFLSSKNTWKDISGQYFHIKELLTKKYGKPKSESETFNSPTPPSNDVSRMNEILMDRCYFRTVFENSKGTISVTINHEGNRNAFVMITYIDKINYNLQKSEMMDDL